MTSSIEFPNVFKAYDVRAVYPEPLSESVAYRIGFGAGSFLGKSSPGKPVVVGRDMRPHSPGLVRELQRGLLASGVKVIDAGLVDTPFLYWAVNALDGAGAIQTTASHNPIQYNGFKISGPGAAPIGRESGLREIEALAAGCMYQAGDESPAAEHQDLWEGYREHVHRFLPVSLLDGTVRLKVAVDASNGMAGTMVPKVFAGVPGLELIELHFENDQGSFVHEPNPLVESNLRWTQEAVREHGCDFGVCFDGDADRCVLVDEQGHSVGCDLATAWLAPSFLTHGGGVVYDLRSSKILPETVKSFGGEAHLSRVGHVFMKSKMKETGSSFGGELSGHFYFKDNWCADSGAIAFAAFCARMVAEAKPLSECIGPLRRYCQSGEINFEVDDKTAAMDRLVAASPEAEVLNVDGVTVNHGSWWCNVRPSNTEPLLRLNLEASTLQEVDQRVAEISTVLGGTRVDH